MGGNRVDGVAVMTPDACRKRGHGRVVCEDCGTAWPTPCRSCRGTGHSGNLHDELCPDCAGSRREHLRDEAAVAKRDERAMREYDPKTL